MGERQNTIVCSFDLRSPRISAFEIHEWIYASLSLEEQEIVMVQIDGPKRQEYIHVQFKDGARMEDVLLTTLGLVEYKHTNGEIFHIRISAASLGVGRVRIANLRIRYKNYQDDSSDVSYGILFYSD
jgi:hypothetical protein